MKAKKGVGISDLFSLVMVILTVGLVVGIGSIIMEDVAEEAADQGTRIVQTDTNIADLSDSYNASLPPSAYLHQCIYHNNTNATTNELDFDDTVYGITIVYGDTIQYATLVQATSGLSNLSVEGEEFNVSCNFSDYTSETYQSLNNSKLALADVSDWFGVIVVVLIAVIILGLIISALGSKSGIGAS